MISLLSLSAVSCDFTRLTDAIDDFKIIIGLEKIDTFAGIQIVDAATGELISGEVEVRFAGKNGGDVVDLYNDTQTQMTVEEGLATSGLKNSVSPTSSNPASVTLIVSADGYLDHTAEVTMASKGSTQAVVRLISVAAPPSNVTVSGGVVGSAGSNGAVGTALEFGVQNISKGLRGEASVDIPRGTTLLAENGAPLSGSLRADIVFENSMDASTFRSGLGLPLTNQGKRMTPAAVMRLQISDASGRRAASARSAAGKGLAGGDGMRGGALEIEGAKACFTVPVEVYNSIKDDITPFFTCDESGTCELQEPAGGAIIQNGLATVCLSLESIPAWVGFGTSDASACDVTLSINRNGNSGAFELLLNDASTTYIAYVPSGFSTVVFEDVASGPVTLLASLPQGSFVAAAGPACPAGSATLDLPSAAGVIDSEITVELDCGLENGERRYASVDELPSSAIFYRPSSAAPGTGWFMGSSPEWNYVEGEGLEGGSFTAWSVVSGQSYDFQVVYGGDIERKNGVSILGPSFKYTLDISSSDFCE